MEMAGNQIHTIQHAETAVLSLSSKIKAITQYIFSEQWLPVETSNYAPLLQELACAAVGIRIQRFFDAKRESREKVKLAVFLLVRMIENSDELQDLLLEPEKLMSVIEDDILYLLERRLTERERTLVIAKIKRKVGTAHLRVVSEASRTRFKGVERVKVKAELERDNGGQNHMQEVTLTPEDDFLLGAEVDEDATEGLFLTHGDDAYQNSETSDLQGLEDDLIHHHGGTVGTNTSLPSAIDFTIGSPHTPENPNSQGSRSVPTSPTKRRQAEAQASAKASSRTGTDYSHYEDPIPSMPIDDAPTKPQETISYGFRYSDFTSSEASQRNSRIESPIAPSSLSAKPPNGSTADHGRTWPPSPTVISINSSPDSW